MVFLDLEDAVAPLEKPAARAKVVNAINTLDWGESVLCVRVNAWDTEWTYRDVIEVVGGRGERLDEVMLPKVRDRGRGAGARPAAHPDREERPAASRARRHRGADRDDAWAHQRRGDLRRVADRLETIIFGPADFAASMEMPVLTGGVQIPEYPGDHFHYVFVEDPHGRPRQRAAGDRRAVPQDPRAPSASASTASAPRSSATTASGRCTPTRSTILNEIFSPTQEQFDRACDILDAYEKATTEGDRKGAVMFGDEMIDEASRKMAIKFVRRGERAGSAVCELNPS